MNRLVLALILLLAACGAPTAPPLNDEPGGDPDSDAPSPSASASSSASTTLEPIPVADLDEEHVAALVAEGHTETEALFLALTNVDARRIDAEHYEIVAAFPTGNVAMIDVALTFDAVGDPEELSIDSEETGDGGLRLRLKYLVPYERIPDDVLEQLREVVAGDRPAPSEDRRLAFAGIGHVVAEESTGVGVAIDAFIGQARDDAFGAFVDLLQQRMDTTAIDAVLQGIKSVGDIEKALEMSVELAKLNARIDALEDCARNPTNPITKKRYADDPNALQQILDAIERVRVDVKSNVAVLYVGLLNKTASGLVKVPGLGYVVGMGTAWSEETLRALNESYIEELRQLIPRCTGYQFEIAGKAFGTRAGDPARIEFHFWGVRCPDAEVWRIWEVVDGENLDVYVTQGPSSEQEPLLATFAADGQLKEVVTMGQPFPIPTTWYGTTFVIETPEAPMQITARIPLGDREFKVTERIVPADDSIFECP